uniref:Protein transport protein SEC13 n=1 Tax=Polytomella parva TaxID=51329 RepID=A0A7S0YNX3_9CHLO|mmetsp:Transcript_34971/g.62869  ORF Transcript_34971/g.62869 Transcript_34971/m.62869 type:complete len:323 (+) Transcript_34971:89-1057(+)|eukprot:CAMPEP_0175051318 /NCGR_PEP_ID=MMETSP0052_2-20121109/7727_1 /TAXON_ID=51329 ORGANISM="Polytomella parva, Strain SAG 63-3" /NCGR_SAMPLE_ID=MMETSP0052_2 /ASSEMBLY_ACC=CAM_ASM_000194 /LENGTH=322 /DNA_ID=CAMNT_0016315577 /DNA_START=46 /DNA_END=1014 /DNA_ORIENTATION=+
MTAINFDSGHQDMVHDAQFDYYGRRLATCSSDRTIKVFDVVGSESVHLADLKGHEGPVWQVCWAHPKYGSVLASCSFDHRVIVWKESPENTWSQVYITPKKLHVSSINSICWAPHELGLILACGSSDGAISILEYKDGNWDSHKIPNAHRVGCTSVSWAPSYASSALLSGAAPSAPAKRLVSAGCDNCVRIWKCSLETGVWEAEEALKAHTDWVRDVAWAPASGTTRSTIASAGQDGQVFIWREKAGSQGKGGGNEWDRTLLRDFKPTPVWRVSWSTTGDILAVTDATNAVTLWREAMGVGWTQIDSQQAAAATAVATGSSS